MNLRSTWAFGAALLGGPLALAACGNILGLGDFADQETTTSSTTTTSTTTTGDTTSTGTGGTGGGGTGGGGGPGGAAQTFACEQDGPIFDVFSGTDLSGITLNDESLVVVGNELNGWVYVAVSDEGNRQVLVRSFKDGTDASPVIKYPPAPAANDTRAVGGFVRPGNFTVFGTVDGEIGQVVIPQNGELQPSPAPGAQTYAQPAQCTGGGFWALDAVFDGMNVRYVSTCEVAGTSRTLFGGKANGGTPDFVLQGASGDDALLAHGYGFVGNQHFIVVGSDSPSPAGTTAYRYGTTEADLGAVHPLLIEPTTTTFALFNTTTPQNDAFILFAATFDFPANGGLFPAKFWSARLGAADFPTLSSNPMGYFDLNATINGPAELGVPTPPAWSLGGLVSAGATVLDSIASRVLINWWTGAGVPRVIGAIVDEHLAPMAEGRHTKAAAVQGHLGRTAVVWILRSPADTFTVKGRFVNCHIVAP